VIGKELRALELPPGTSVAVVIRDDHVVPTRPETRLRAGDRVLAVTSAEREDELRGLLISE
jgi:Trk K+ transport system NAD-binding subunit